YDSLNSGFEHSVFVPFPPPGSTFTYRFIPNPDLKPETSDGYEAGIRGRFASGSSFQLSAFYNEYEDFIETVTLPGSTPADTTFQFQNLSEVTRSEEHTSELQSRENIVCRLLLEKKKGGALESF